MSLTRHLEPLLVSAVNSEFNSRQSGVKWGVGGRDTCFHKKLRFQCCYLFFFYRLKITHSINVQLNS